MLCRCAERIIEVRAELMDERLAEELVYPDSFTAALLEGLLANRLFMDIEGQPAAGQPRHADGIEPA